MNRPRILVLALALALPSIAFSYGIETRGEAPSLQAPLGTYGMGVSSRVGLKSLVPQGWKVYVHQNAKLPDTLDWSVQDTWITALERMTTGTDLSILIDWNTRSLMVRTKDLAIQESAARQEIAQAAVTPLPKFETTRAGSADKDVPVPQPAATISEPPVAASSVSVEPPVTAPTVNVTTAVETKTASSSTAVLPPAEVALSVPPAPAPESKKPSFFSRMWSSLQPNTGNRETQPPVVVAAQPVIRINPTPAMVAAQKESIANNPPELTSTEDFGYTDAIAFNRPTAKKVVTAIAAKYKLNLVWALSHELPLKGPVTLLANSAEQDLMLLNKALGPHSGVLFELTPSDDAIRVYSRGSARPILVPVFKGVTASSAPSPLVDLPSTTKSAPLPNTGLTLELRSSQPLEDALNAFAKNQGYTLDWQVQGGFESKKHRVYTGATLAQVLSEVLPPLGLSADIHTADKLIIVRLSEAKG